MNKKILLFVALCFSFAVNADVIMPDGMSYAVAVEQDQKAYSVILANDASEKLVNSTFKTNKDFAAVSLDKDRTINYQFISSDFLAVDKVLDHDLSYLKPDKPKYF